MVKSRSYHLGKQSFDFSEGANMLQLMETKGRGSSRKVVLGFYSQWQNL